MKKILIILSIFFLIIGFIPLGPNNNIVSASSTITLENWEAWNIGDNPPFNGSLLTVNSTNATYPEISGENEWYTTGTKTLYIPSSSLNTDEIWINFSNDYNFINSIEFFFTMGLYYVDSGNPQMVFNFYDDNELTLKFDISTSSNAQRGLDVYGNNGTVDITSDWGGDFDGLNGEKNVSFKISHNYDNIMTYEFYNYTDENNPDLQYSSDWTSYEQDADDFDTFDRIHITIADTGDNNVNLHMDDIVLVLGQAPPTVKSFYVNFFDFETGLYFDYFNLVGPIHPSSISQYLSGSLSSDLNSDIAYSFTNAPFPLQLTGEFSSGSWHYINLTGITTWIQDVNIAFYDFSTYIQIYEGQTYTFGLTQVEWSEDIVNMECGNHYSWFHNWPTGHTLEYCLSTDKLYYDVGETVNIRYKIPSIKDLVDHGVDTSDWELWIYDSDNITNVFGMLFFDNGDSADLVYKALVYDKQWHSINFDPKTPDAGADKYYMTIAKPGFLGQQELIYKTYLTFYVTPTAFTPSGNITAISPIDPVMGQAINITWDANNNGKLVYRNVYDPTEVEHTISGFTKFTGSKQTEFYVWDLGQYFVNLYVSDGELDQLVDTSMFYVNDTNGSLGGFGYGIEFLTVIPYRAVAGFDQVKINYKTLEDDTKITVIDGRDQTTPYGTLTNNGTGTLHFKLPPNAPIGNWTVTMYGNETHNTSFYVIADENNYFKFLKHIYYEGEQLTLSLVHDKKIALTFYKNDVAQGQDIVFDIQQQTIGVYNVPLEIIEPSEGIWTCEMWEVNNLIKIRLLARDDCKVVFLPIGKPTEEGFQSILGMIAMSSAFFGGGSFGLMMISLIIIGVVIFTLSYLKTDGSTITLLAIITCLALVYIGWIPAWIGIIAVVFTGLMFGEALSKKLNLGGKK